MRLYSISDNKAIEITRSDDHFYEKDIEDFIQNNPRVLFNEPILIFGRQVHTASGKILDLLALDKYGRIIVIELKRGIAPRDMIAQILDYSSWLKKLSERELENIARAYFHKNNLSYKSIHTAFEEFFNVKNAPIIGSELVNVLFAQDYPEDLMNAVSYLTDSGVPIYLLKFNWFKDSLGSRFILIETIVGEEEEEEFSKSDEAGSSKNIGNKYSIRQLFNQVKKRLENDYSDWVTQYDAEWKGFKVYQTKAGNWISVRGDWFTGDGFYQLLFGLSISENSKNLIARVSFPKRILSESLGELLQSLSQNHYYENPPRVNNKRWKNQITYVKNLAEISNENQVELNDELLLNFVKSETPKMVDFINQLLPVK